MTKRLLILKQGVYSIIFVLFTDHFDLEMTSKPISNDKTPAVTKEGVYAIIFLLSQLISSYT